MTFLQSMQYTLPPQASWTLNDWYANRDGVDELKTRGIGWDLTDFGSGDYHHKGLLLYTLSNGILGSDGKPVDQPYANKLLIVGPGQVTPTHHHWKKMEDIICLGGGGLQIELHNVGRKDSVDTTGAVRILHNGMWETYDPGTVVTLPPGARIRLEPHHYHKFWGQPHQGTVLVEEVSTVNDDKKDNCFLPQDHVGRFPNIEEDSMPRHLLCHELPGTPKFDELVARYLQR